MNNTTLDAIVAIHKDMKMLNWWDGEDPFQIIVETMGTQQCKLIEASIWSYDLKLMADESIGGNLLSVVENELNDWIIKENSSWIKEAQIAQGKQDWDRSKIHYLRNDDNRRAAVATRSLWAWYGKKFPLRIYPKFITTKDWSREHKQWLVETTTDNILSKLNFNIIASKRKLDGIRDFITTELNGGLKHLRRNTALKPLQRLKSVGDETARKIALFYFKLPFVIFDEYLLRVSKRHRWLAADCDKWNASTRKVLDTAIFNSLSRFDDESKAEKLKAFHAVINDCGNLYCKKDEPTCNGCPLSSLLNENERPLTSSSTATGNSQLLF